MGGKKNAKKVTLKATSRGKGKSTTLTVVPEKKKPSSSVPKLTRDVKALKLTQRGSIQFSRQVLQFVAPPDPQPATPYFFEADSPSNLRPICWLHQAISPGSVAHTCRYTPPVAPATNPTLPQLQAGRWIEQEYPPVANYNVAAGTNGLFNQIQYWSQSEGTTTSAVSNDYTHMSTKYQVKVNAQDCRGYFDVFIIHPKKSYIRSTQKDVTLPTGLQGFTNLSLGSIHQFTLNKQYYSCKLLKRKYFNTARAPGGAGSSAGYLQTNPDLDFQFTIKNRKSRQHIKAPELFDGGILDSTDIPYHKQDWILISTTLENKDVSSANGLKFIIHRSPTWRDREGASV